MMYIKPAVAALCAVGCLLASALGPVSATGATDTLIDCAGAKTAQDNATPANPAKTVEAVPTQPAAQQEQNPPGDIPDNQAFVPFSSGEGGYIISMPEGWARTESGANVSFADKFHTFSVEVSCAAAAPTIDSANTVDVAELMQQEAAFSLTNVSTVDLPARPAVRIEYQANSAPDEVTGKTIRLDVDRYELFHDGKLAVITFRVPAGSDNVDVANLVSESFQWSA